MDYENDDNPVTVLNILADLLIAVVGAALITASVAYCIGYRL